MARGSAPRATMIARRPTLLRPVFLFNPLAAWPVNLEKRLVTAPKAHLVDSGLAACLAGHDHHTEVA